MIYIHIVDYKKRKNQWGSVWYECGPFVMSKSSSPFAPSPLCPALMRVVSKLPKRATSSSRLDAREVVVVGVARGIIEQQVKRDTKEHRQGRSRVYTCWIGRQCH